MTVGSGPEGRVEFGRIGAWLHAVSSSRARALEGLGRENQVVVRRVDPWSVLRVAFAWSLVLLVVWLVAVLVLYAMLAAMGVFASLNQLLGDVTGSGRVGLPGLGFVFMAALVFGLVDVVLLTALSTLGALIYNTIAGLVGGVEVTLADLE